MLVLLPAVIASRYLSEAISKLGIATATENHRPRNDTVGRWTVPPSQCHLPYSSFFEIGDSYLELSRRVKS
jgi:hypothetical protein